MLLHRVKFGELWTLSPEFTRVECEMFVVTWPVAFQNGLQYHSFNFSVLIGNHFSTSYRNLVRLGSVTLEFTILECVQRASII